MMTGKAEFDKMDKNGVIDIVNFNYGKKHENPLDYVNFYSKIDYDKAGPREKEDVSLLLPKVFEEQLVRFYWKEELEDYTEVKRGFEKWAKSAYTEKQKKCKTCKQHIIDPNRTEQDKGLKELTRSTTGTSSTTGTTTTTTTTKEKGLH